MKIFLASLFSLSVLYSFSQKGFLDESFGDNGKVTKPDSLNYFTGAVQKDDKILAGSGYTGYKLVRYMPDGAIDSSFGNNGIASAKGDFLTAIQPQPDGNIITAGVSTRRIIAVKFKTNGQLDSTFGNNGVSQIDFGENEWVNALTVQADGKIVLAGNGPSFFDNQSMLLIRLNADGSVDASFGDSGRVVNTSGYDITCIALQDDRKIVTGGHNWPIGGNFADQFSISRYNEDGNLDESFGINGTVLTDITNGNDYPFAITVLPDGKIIAAGDANYDQVGGSYMAAVKYNTDGLLDESFGENGIAKVLFEDQSEAKGMLIQKDGKIILTGYQFSIGDTSTADFALTRLTSNGSIDTSFGISGKQITDFGGIEMSVASGLQNSGRIVLIGNIILVDENKYSVLLTRYNGDYRTYVKYRIRKWIHNHVLHWQNMQASNNTTFYAIEHSNNAVNDFTEIGRVASDHLSAVNSDQVYSYALADNSKVNTQQINYYRIKALNKDGSAVYSDVLSDAIDTQEVELNVYPNPVRNVLNIKGLNATMSYELLIMNAKGNSVASTKINNASSYKWNLQSLSKGIYYLNITSNQKTTTVKFIKQ